MDPSVVDPNGVYEKIGPARVFIRESDAVRAIKSKGPDRVSRATSWSSICRGPLGAGMEEVYQVTSALSFLSFGKKSRLDRLLAFRVFPPGLALATSARKRWRAGP